MDWYAENILSVTGEYYGVEKTIEKEFDVFKDNSSRPGGSGASAGSCAHVSPYSFSSQEDTPKGIAFSKSGTKMFIAGIGSDAVNEYTLTGAYCIGTASFVDSFSINSQDTVLEDLAFNKSGTKMFVVGNTDDDVNEYTLTTGWDVSTASFVDSFSVSSQDGKPHGIAFSKSGTKMFITGNDDNDVNEYTLTTGWDVSTASFVDSFSINSQETAPRGIAFSKSGMKMFVAGDNGNDVNEYTLTTAWDVSTASFVDSFSISSQEAQVRDIWFDSSGKTMFIVGIAGDDVNVYKLTTAWDVSTASFTG
jgi:hypothetical protein